jgi:DNA (cytosine-5)-methyltransferase 1
MSKLRILDLFSGIGGFSLGLERTGGFETVAFCEIEPFPRRVLAKHWPGVPCYEDVRTLTAARLAADGITGINVITGGFPCQDLSVAGKQRGMGEGTRSGLWSEIVRLAGELRPDYLIVENVAALLAGPSERRGGWFGRVLGDLAECGYDAEWENIPAAALGAPHRRERVWFVAYPQHGRLPIRRRNSQLGKASDGLQRVPSHDPQSGHQQAQPILADTYGQYAQRQQPSNSNAQGWTGSVAGPARPRHSGGRRQWDAEPDVGRVAHGVPDRAHRLKGLGNAVVPAIPELIGRAILAARASA